MIPNQSPTVGLYSLETSVCSPYPKWGDTDTDIHLEAREKDYSTHMFNCDECVSIT